MVRIIVSAYRSGLTLDGLLVSATGGQVNYLDHAYRRTVDKSAILTCLIALKLSDQGRRALSFLFRINKQKSKTK